MIQARPFQDDMLNEARAKLRALIRRILFQAPTGSGKTILAAIMLGNSASKGLRSWFVVHRKELLRQSSSRFRDAGVAHSFIASNEYYDKRAMVHICGVQTLVRRLDRVEKPDIIIWDECHHAAATSWSKIMAQYPDTIHIGLSATPERLDGKGLDKYFDYIIKGPTVEWLIEHGYLSPYKIYAPNPVSMEGVATSMGDYAKSDVQKKMDKRSITGDAITHYNKLCRGAQFIAFCSGIEHSKHVAEQFTAAGIPCLHVDGETPDDERLEAMRKLESREVLGLSNVDLFGEGVDVPSLQAVILLRPTQSRGLHLQQIGRALRPSANKPYAVILDHAGNSLRLGLPDDPIEWSLKGREKAPKGSKAEVATKSCPICFAVVRPMVAKCPDPCGHVFINKERKVTVKEGELQEVDVAAARYKRLNEQRAADTVEALVALGQQRGYKNPHAWAYQLNRAREAKQAKRRG